MVLGRYWHISEYDLVQILEDNNYTADSLEVTEEGTEATVETTGFSYYTVEFTYNNLQYVLNGGESIPLSTILDTLGLTGEVTAATVSNSNLFTVSNKTGEWIVTALQAFSTNEWMKVTINGVVYNATNGVFDNSFSLWKSTDWIDVSVFSNYNLDVSSPANSFGLAWYDTNKTFISGIKYGQTQKQESGSIPSGAKYVRFCCQYYEQTQYAPVESSVTLVLSQIV